jgi:predicted nucleic acid-binding protein
MRAVDTNILLYAHDPRDHRKQELAGSLIQSLTDGVLIWQVACEYVAGSRKFHSIGFDEQQAWRSVFRLQEVWTTFLPSWETLQRAERLYDAYHLSFWDALIVSACVECDVTHLYTEDMGGTPIIEGVKIINPFKGGFADGFVLTRSDNPPKDEDKELFDHLMEAEGAAHKLIAQMTELSAETNKISGKLDSYNRTVEAAHRKKKFSVQGKMNLLLAEDINRYARWIEELSSRFDENAHIMNIGYTFYFNNINLQTAEQRNGLLVEHRVITDLLETILQNIEGARKMRDAVEGLKGYTKNLSRASERFVPASDNLISAFAEVESFCLTALSIIDDKLRDHGNSD